MGIALQCLGHSSVRPVVFAIILSNCCGFCWCEEEVRALETRDITEEPTESIKANVGLDISLINAYAFNF